MNRLPSDWLWLAFLSPDIFVGAVGWFLGWTIGKAFRKLDEAIYEIKS